jgi:hypothetical protein
MAQHLVYLKEEAGCLPGQAGCWPSRVGTRDRVEQPFEVNLTKWRPHPMAFDLSPKHLLSDAAVVLLRKAARGTCLPLQSSLQEKALNAHECAEHEHNSTARAAAASESHGSAAEGCSHLDRSVPNTAVADEKRSPMDRTFLGVEDGQQGQAQASNGMAPTAAQALEFEEATDSSLEWPTWQDLECFHGPLLDTSTGIVRYNCCAADGMHCSLVLVNTDGAVQAALNFVESESRLPTSGGYASSGYEATLARTLQLHADRFGLQTWDGAMACSLAQSVHAVPALTKGHVARLRAALPELWLTGSLASRFLKMLKRIQHGCACTSATAHSPAAGCSCTAQWRARQLRAAQRRQWHACGLTEGRELLLLKEGLLSSQLPHQPLRPYSQCLPVEQQATIPQEATCTRARHRWCSGRLCCLSSAHSGQPCANCVEHHHLFQGGTAGRGHHAEQGNIAANRSWLPQTRRTVQGAGTCAGTRGASAHKQRCRNEGDTGDVSFVCCMSVHDKQRGTDESTPYMLYPRCTAVEAWCEPLSSRCSMWAASGGQTPQRSGQNASGSGDAAAEGPTGRLADGSADAEAEGAPHAVAHNACHLSDGDDVTVWMRLFPREVQSHSLQHEQAPCKRRRTASVSAFPGLRQGAILGIFMAVSNGWSTDDASVAVDRQGQDGTGAVQLVPHKERTHMSAPWLVDDSIECIDLVSDDD